MKVYDFDNYKWNQGINLQVDAAAAETIEKNIAEEVKKAAEASDYNKVAELIDSWKVITNAIDALKEKEKEKSKEDADPENDWVYVSTGALPTHDYDVLITGENDGNTFICIDRYDGNEWFNFGTNVIAWRELPEPAEPKDGSDA